MGSASDIHETGVWVQHGLVDVTLNFRRDHGHLTFNGLFQNNDDSATSLDNGSYWHFLFHCWTFLVECEDGRSLNSAGQRAHERTVEVKSSLETVFVFPPPTKQSW